MNLKPLLLFAPLILLGCMADPQENGKTVAPTVNRTTGTRVVIEYKQDFQDTTAYNDWRTIIIVKDTETGKEFLGVSGMGVIELGSHLVGKVQTPDER